MKPQKLGTRAVLRMIEPGSEVNCAHCSERVKFQAKRKLRQVICNVYKQKRWDRVEHFHEECYEIAGEPHGVYTTDQPHLPGRKLPRPLSAAIPA